MVIEKPYLHRTKNVLEKLLVSIRYTHGIVKVLSIASLKQNLVPALDPTRCVPKMAFPEIFSERCGTEYAVQCPINLHF